MPSVCAKAVSKETMCASGALWQLRDDKLCTAVRTGSSVKCMSNKNIIHRHYENMVSTDNDLNCFINHLQN